VSPLAWYIDRYKIKRDKESGILNDPNGWFACRRRDRRKAHHGFIGKVVF
jgi:predicted helicase